VITATRAAFPVRDARPMTHDILHVYSYLHGVNDRRRRGMRRYDCSAQQNRCALPRDCPKATHISAASRNRNPPPARPLSPVARGSMIARIGNTFLRRRDLLSTALALPFVSRPFSPALAAPAAAQEKGQEKRQSQEPEKPHAFEAAAVRATARDLALKPYKA